MKCKEGSFSTPYINASAVRANVKQKVCINNKISQQQSRNVILKWHFKKSFLVPSSTAFTCKSIILFETCLRSFHTHHKRSLVS